MKIMCNEAFDAWLSLFNENAANAWGAERKELRKAAMLLSVLDLELRGIQKTVSDEFYMWQKRLTSLESLKRSSQASPPSRKGILQEQKENRTPDHDVFAGIMPLHDLSNQNQMLFNSDVFLIKSSPDESGIELDKHANNSPERDQIVIKETCVSPKINKTWKYSRLKRPCDITSSYSLLDITKTPKSTSEMVVDDDFTATPDKEVIETTIIDVTPEPLQETKKFRHSKLGNLLNQKKKAKGQKANKVASNSTLTQMFSNVVASTKNKESSKKAEFDDLTYCPIINVESCDKYSERKPDSNLDDPLKKENDDSDLTYCPTSDINLMTAKNNNKEQPAKLVTEACTSKFQDEGNPDSTKKQGSKTPCKSNIPFKFKMKPVRGKERLKLEGWNCEECRRFYEGMGENFAAAKEMMNKCSRHRNVFKPDDYTAPGFWDLNFTPTQHTEEDQSTVFNF